MTILFLDTTSDSLQVALGSAEGLTNRLHETEPANRFHASLLIPKIKAMLKESGLAIPHLTGVAVNCGPGSFTGIRTGLTVSRILGQFVNLDCYGFNTFELIATLPQYRGQQVTILLNAFRNQHYRASLKVDANVKTTWFIEPVVYNNTESLPVVEGICLLDPSLSLDLPESQPLELEKLFMPDAMQFYLANAPEQGRKLWSELEPCYMQLPNISQPKSQQPQAS